MIRTDQTASRLLLGSGRSGTTWVLDNVANANDLRPVFEPLHEAESQIGNRYAYGVLMSGDSNETLAEYFRSLSRGLIHNRWIDYRGRTSVLFPSPTTLATVSGLKRLVRNWREFTQNRADLSVSVKRCNTLIKCIRANLMAGWLAQDLGFRTVLIVRHPCAVVASQYRLGYIWDPTPVTARYRSNLRLHEITNGKYLPLLNSKLNKLQALTLNWIIENQWPVQYASEGSYSVFHYELLLHDASRAWPALCTALCLRAVPDETVLKKPSQQTSTKTAGNDGTAGCAPPWLRYLTSHQLTEIQAMLDATECDLYDISTEAPLKLQSQQIPASAWTT